MDFAEISVLRRKRPLLLDILNFSVPSQKMYREYDLLGDKILPEIMAEQTDVGQTTKFLDMLHETDPGAFEKLSRLLVDEGHSWLRNEMKADLLAEKGELQVEEYVYRESGMHVFKSFGQSKRISEIEKKEVQALIAIRYQAAKEAWCDQLRLVTKELDDLRHSQLHATDHMCGLLGKFSTFLDIQKPRLGQYPHDFAGALARSMKNPDAADPGNSQLLNDLVDWLLKLLVQVFAEKEKLEAERGRCLKVLRVDRQHVANLDLILLDALRRAAEDLVRSQQETNQTCKKVKLIDEDMKLLKVESSREISNRSRQLHQANLLIKEQEEKIRKLERQLAESKAKYGEMNDEVINWKKRCEMLEKTRRLGYYYPGWHDKLYNMADIEYGQIPGESAPPKLVLIGRTRNSPIASPRSRTRTSPLDHAQEKFYLESRPVTAKKKSARFAGLDSPGEEKLLNREKTSVTPNLSPRGQNEEEGDPVKPTARLCYSNRPEYSRQKTTIVYESSKYC